MSEEVIDRPLNRAGNRRGNFNWNKVTGGPNKGQHLPEVHRLKINASVRRRGIKKIDEAYAAKRKEKLDKLTEIERRIEEIEASNTDRRQDSSASGS